MLDWWYGGFEPLVLVEGKWETPPQLSNHQSKPPIRGELIFGQASQTDFLGSRLKVLNLTFQSNFVLVSLLWALPSLAALAGSTQRVVQRQKRKTETKKHTSGSGVIQGPSKGRMSGDL